MQSYPIKLAAGGAQTISTSARRFVYESGVTDPIGGDARIVVKPDSGNEIVLRPGQSFGLAPGEVAGNWFVRAKDPTSKIVGDVIIGSGEFDDGTFKVDSSTGTIAVRPEGGFQIVNTTANRVPVSLDPATEKAMKEAPIMTYNARRFASLNVANAFNELLKPSDNINGVILENVQVTINGSCAIYAGDAQPSSLSGGEILIGYLQGGGSYAKQDFTRIELQPGKGLYTYAYSAATNTWACALLTIKP